MKKFALITVFIVVGIIVLVSLGRVKNEPGDYTFSLVYEGRTRAYLVHVPPSYDSASKMGVVFNLHGGGTTGLQQRYLSRFNGVADTLGFIVVYPEGVEKQWNDGRSGIDSVAHRENIDDVGFILAVLTEIRKTFSIDSAKVFAAGISNGAQMTNRLACERADIFAGIATVAGSFSEDLAKICRPSQPISVLLMNGTSDPLLPYQGGSGGGELAGYRGEGLSVADTIAFWAENNGCSVTPRVEKLPNTAPSDGTTVEHITYGCLEGVGLELYKIIGGGHTWPGNNPAKEYIESIEKVFGKTTLDINGSEIIGAFFVAHHR